MKKAAATTKTNIDTALLKAATAALARETGLQLDYATEKNQNGILAVHGHKMPPVKWMAMTKRWAVNTPFGTLIQQYNALPDNRLLVADYINPVLAQRLKEQDAQFIDTAGNAYLNQLPVYVWVAGKKPQLAQDLPAAPAKAFTSAALKIIYCLLCDIDLINAPYRKIADDADVALGTVGDVLKQLKELGYIRVMHNTKTLELRDRRHLLEEWMKQYPQKLKKKHHFGTYIADDPQWWKTFAIEECDGLWGGEVAAAKLTGYLKPRATEIYIPNGKVTDLLRRAKLRKPHPWELDQAGLVYINTLTHDTPFATHQNTVCPILVYADLMAQDDPRLNETAELLYEQHIKPRWET